ncbi:MAG: hypothetical protein WCX63_08940 [Methanoregula sp.]
MAHKLAAIYIHHSTGRAESRRSQPVAGPTLPHAVQGTRPTRREAKLNFCTDCPFFPLSGTS